MLNNILDDIAKNINQGEFKLKYKDVSLKSIPKLNSLFFDVEMYIKKGLVIDVKVDKILLMYIKKTEDKLKLNVREFIRFI